MKHKKNESHDIEINKGDVAYIKLEKFVDRKVSKTIRIFDLIPNYKGCNVMLDFSEDNVLIGIEILA
jgi:Protein of unknown function (DUF2283)